MDRLAWLIHSRVVCSDFAVNESGDVETLALRQKGDFPVVGVKKCGVSFTIEEYTIASIFLVVLVFSPSVELRMAGNSFVRGS